MKKLILLLFLLLSVTVLQACSVIDPILEDRYRVTTEESNLQAMLMETRTDIRLSNVGVKVDLYEERFGGSFTRVAGTSQGSGVVYKLADGYYYAITNFHVIDQKDYPRADYHIIPSFDTEEIEASVVVYDAERDLAIIRFSSENLDIPLIDIHTRLNETGSLKRDEMVLAVGNPSAVNSIVTYGEYLGMSQISNVEFNVILHSALIYPGNSGGALTDIEGHLIGINTWGTEDNDERNLAIPLRVIHDFLEEHTLLP